MLTKVKVVYMRMQPKTTEIISRITILFRTMSSAKKQIDMVLSNEIQIVFEGIIGEMVFISRAKWFGTNQKRESRQNVWRK